MKEKTIKVVINKRYGGFGISQKALMQLIELKNPFVEVTPVNEYFKHDATYRSERERRESVDWFEHIWKDDMIYSLRDYSDDRYKLRADLDLIRIIENLGAEANGQYANLVIVEVPADIEWTIKECDGKEWVAEVHRTWG